MEAAFSLRDVLLIALRGKFFTDEEARVWAALIDQLYDEDMRELWQIFASEHAELSAALKSLDDYLPHLHACEKRRHDWLQKIESRDVGLVPAVTAILQSKRHWTGRQIDEAFASDETVVPFLSGLSIRDLEQIRKIVDLHEQAGEYDDDEGEPTGTRDTLIGMIAFLQEDAWEREEKEADSLIAFLTGKAEPPDLHTHVAQLRNDIETVRTKHGEIGPRFAGKATESIQQWIGHPPSWFTIAWEDAKNALEAAALTVGVSGTLAGLGALAAHVLTGGLAAQMEAVAQRV